MKGLDTKLNEHFGGKVVRKDLTKLVKGNAIVPIYVLEYLLGQYCATSDEETNSNNSSLKENTVSETSKSSTSKEVKSTLMNEVNTEESNKSVSDNLNRKSVASNTKSSTQGKTKRTHELPGLPMYVRKNKGGGFVYSTGADDNLTGLVATSATVQTSQYREGLSVYDKKDFEITAQPETTDQMLDIIQAVY
jgi:hypothetical protein